MGLPTSNIFTGGHDAHSEREWICVEDMGLAAATLVELVKVWAEYAPGTLRGVEPLLDRLGARSRRCASRSRTAATSAASTACRRRSSVASTRSSSGSELLSLEEIARVVGVFAGLGVRTVRITGGEPLVRRNVEHLVELLAAIERPTAQARARADDERLRPR